MCFLATAPIFLAGRFMDDGAGLGLSMNGGGSSADGHRTPAAFIDWRGGARAGRVR
jgi:hypothetical protein